MNAFETLAARQISAHPAYRNLRLRRALYQSAVDWVAPERVINIGCGYQCPYRGTKSVYMFDKDKLVVESYERDSHNDFYVDGSFNSESILDKWEHFVTDNCLVVCEGLFAYLTIDQCFEIVGKSREVGSSIIFDWPSAADYTYIDGAIDKSSTILELGDFDFLLPNGSRIITYLPPGTTPAE
ncbi:hypothetical protein CCP2SC5_740020 [Azospirillaceae bacterium]